jgi:hypothetical protein
MRRPKSKALVTAIRKHPCLIDDTRRITTEYLNWRDQLGVHNKVLSNLGREHLLLEHTLYLHVVRGEAIAEHGATFERLAALSAARDDVGARATRTALRLAQIAGFVVQTRSPTDGRLRIFEPSDLLLETIRSAFLKTFRIFDELAPQLRIGARLAEEPDYLSAILIRLGRAFLKVPFRPDRKLTAFENLQHLEGGRPILATAVDCHWRGLDLPTSQEIARQFYVSASQIRAVLKQAESYGLIQTGARGRLIDAEPLVEAFLDARAALLAIYAEHAFDLDADAFAGHDVEV